MPTCFWWQSAAHLHRTIKQAAFEGALRGAVLAVDSIGVIELHVLHGCLLDSLAHLLTRSLFWNIWQTALTRRTAELARASGSLVRSVAVVAYCCAQAARADTSSLAMLPATHAHLPSTVFLHVPCKSRPPNPSFCDVPHELHFAKSCILHLQAVNHYVLQWLAVFWVCCVAGGFFGFACHAPAGLLNWLAVVPWLHACAKRAQIRIAAAPHICRTRRFAMFLAGHIRQTPGQHLPNVVLCNVPCKPHPPNIGFRDAH